MQREQTTSRDDDATLVRSAQTGDVQAFDTLVRRYQDRVYNACWRICRNPDDALDLTQEAFVKAYQAIDRFQGTSGFYTWIFRIAVNLALSHRKKAKLRLVTSLDDNAGPGSEGRESAAQRLSDDKTLEPPAQAEAGEMHKLVASALQAIEEHHRSVAVLRDIEGLDYRQIAEVLDAPLGTIKSRVHRARAALREELEKRTANVRANPGK
ncbi:MAG: sigma-70 family RNA polymerase sigma factor [Phycisphaerae bacterium]